MATFIMIMNSFLSLLFFIIALQLSSTSAATFNIEQFGAVGDGKTDTKQAMLAAWSTACNSAEPTTILVPSKTYFISSVVLDGSSCKSSSTTFQMEGSTFVAPDFTKTAPDYWISFNGVKGVSLIGGHLDGQGTSLWDCKARNPTPPCPDGASSLGFLNSQHILVQNLTSSNAKLYHLVFLSNKNVTLEKVTIQAPGDSPNTDGIHVQGSIQVRIIDSNIMTGDDCISIGPGTQDLRMLGLNCGPGHGISIGSLGKDAVEAGVEGVLVRNSTFTGSTNGVRIKTWARPSNGFVRGINFEKIIMNNVENPILIDQNYCPHNTNCPNKSSGVKISNVTYSNIVGTSATQVAMNFNCSASAQCQGITLEAINLTYKNGPANSFCLNAHGSVRGAIFPPSCLAP